jgi:hypothetical protein
MTTPALFNTPFRIVAHAMWNAGLLPHGEDPNPEQYAKYLDRLSDLVNLWQTQGLKLWLQQDIPVTLVAGSNPYNLGPAGTIIATKPTRVLDNGYYLDVNNVKRPINMISRDEYTRLSNTIQQGPITAYFVDKKALNLVVYLWYVPDAAAATGTVHLTIQQQVAGFVSLSDTIQFPLEWFMALHWGLADEISTGQPQAIMDRCEKRAMAYRIALEDWDVEDASTTFTPDNRTQQNASSFR